MTRTAQTSTCLSQRRRPLVIVSAALAVLACSQPLAPGDLLLGTWSSADATLNAERSGATLTIPCIAVRFAALRLDDSLAFQATGVVTRAGGLVTVRVGDAFPLTGRVLGSRIVIPYPWVVPTSGQDTLAPGDRGIHVCNA